MENLDMILIALLSVSEVLAVLPWFKGNGILDYAIKILRKLTGKKLLLFLLLGVAASLLINDVYNGLTMVSPVILSTFTLVGFSETITSEDVTELIDAIADPHVKTSGNDITVPELNKVLGYYAIGATIFAPQLASPSLRRLALLDVSPYELNDLPVFEPDPIFKGESLIELDEDESLNAYCQNSSATDAVCRMLVWLSDGNVTPITGQIYTIKATGTVTATAEAWSSASLTLSQSLPTGTYQLVGARCVDAAGVAFRFVFIGGTWRPGGICVASEEKKDWKYSRYGMLGEWGSFRHDQVPSIELLRNAAGSTFTLYMDVIKTS
jgi:hypothetical protein